MKASQALALFMSVGHYVAGAPSSSSSSSDPIIAIRDDDDGHQPDSQTIASFEQSGTCMYYYTSAQPNWNKGLYPCIKYCDDNGGHGYSECDVSSWIDVDIENSNGFPKYTDDDGYPWVPAPCKCENAAVEWLATEIADLVVEMLQYLDNIICAVFLSAIQTVADIGLMFIPGEAELKGAADLIRYAKSGYENGMDAANFYTDWVGDTCGVPGWNFDLESMFLDMVFAPDSMMGDGVSSTGCILTGSKRSKCKDRGTQPDPPTTSKVHQGTATTTRGSEPTTTQDTPTTTTDGDSAPTTTTTQGGETGPTTTADGPTTTTADSPTTTTKPTKTSTSTTSTTSSTTSTAGAACAYCGEFPKIKAARDENSYGNIVRAASGGKNKPFDPNTCIKAPTEGEYIPVLGGVGVGGIHKNISDVAHDPVLARSFVLVDRALSQKKSTIKTTLGNSQFEWTCFVGKYWPSSDAANQPDISKYWQFKQPPTGQACSVEVEQVGASSLTAAGIKDYQTDHVFEAQTLARFIKWLANEDGEKVGTTYDKPSAAWVENNILDENGFLIVKPGKTQNGDLFTPSTGEVPYVLMTYGFGRSDGVKGISANQDVERISQKRGNENLALIYHVINGAKGVWFEMGKPATKWSTKKGTKQDEARLDVRRGVGPFNFLKQTDPATQDPIWEKWARVANWIDLVCYTFDQQYPWGSDPNGEPKNSAAGVNPSLRSLWAYWIDKELSDIEANAKSWSAAAKRKFDRTWKVSSLTAAERKWRTDAFGTNGFATEGNLRFPRPAGLPVGASEYGAYGWGAVTVDAAGNVDPGIGVPVKIT